MHDMGNDYGNAPLAVSNDGIVIPNSYPGRVWTLASGYVWIRSDHRASSNAINDSDVVVGADNITGVGLSFSQITPGIWGSTQLPPLAGYTHSGASIIDDIGNVFGSSSVTGPSRQEATWWTLANPSAPIDLGPLYIITPTGSVDLGTMIAASYDSTLGIARDVWTVSATGQTFYSDSTGLTTQVPLPAPGTTYTPYGMNASGVVVGDGGNGRAYYWSPGGSQTDLGVLPGYVSSAVWNYQQPHEKPIDDAGNIVGWCSTSRGATTPFLSTPASRLTSAKMLDLSKLLSKPLKNFGLTQLFQAVSINKAGDILCIASAPGNAQYIVLLKPVGTNP
jgi:hypothetical protein